MPVAVNVMNSYKTGICLCTAELSLSYLEAVWSCFWLWMLQRITVKEKRGCIFSGASHEHSLMSWNLDWRRKKQIIKLEIKLTVSSEDFSLLFCPWLDLSLLWAITLPVW